MDIVDIPNQVGRSLKYSVRSRSSFLVSLISAFLVLGIAYDVVYGFFYTRILNAKDPFYGPLFWIGLLVIAVLLPLLFGSLSV
jgi:hypothetical protein